MCMWAKADLKSIYVFMIIVCIILSVSQITIRIRLNIPKT